MPLDRPSLSSPRALGGTVVAGQTTKNIDMMYCVMIINVCNILLYYVMHFRSEKIFSEVSLSAPMINHLFMEVWSN